MAPRDSEPSIATCSSSSSRSGNEASGAAVLAGGPRRGRRRAHLYGAVNVRKCVLLVFDSFEENKKKVGRGVGHQLQVVGAVLVVRRNKKALQPLQESLARRVVRKQSVPVHQVQRAAARRGQPLLHGKGPTHSPAAVGPRRAPQGPTRWVVGWGSQPQSGGLERGPPVPLRGPQVSAADPLQGGIWGGGPFKALRGAPK